MLSDISILVALAAGLVSFLFPCVLPLVPGYISFISGDSHRDLEADTGRGLFLNRIKKCMGLIEKTSGLITEKGLLDNTILIGY